MLCLYDMQSFTAKEWPSDQENIPSLPLRATLQQTMADQTPHHTYSVSGMSGSVLLLI